MWKPTAEQLIRPAVWLALGLGLLERAIVLFGFAFTHIGIDDALIMQVAVDYGNGIFREPFLYGQNYNPMLEALLAAPLVRFGAAPWIVLPLITSLLALLPFWSLALWCMKRGYGMPALLIASFPLALPTEWAMITSMPRGWVHGIALLAFIPWSQDLHRPVARHLTTALVLVAALFCNPNALPLVAGAAVLLIARHHRDPRFWVLSGLAAGLGWLAHAGAQGFYAAYSERVVHPLLPADLHFSMELLKDGAIHIKRHVLHLHPFMSMAWIAVLLILAAAVVLWRHGKGTSSAALVVPLLLMIVALGIPKVHEGCASVFFPQSRMMLAFPILLAISNAVLIKDLQLPRTVLLTLPIAWVGAVALKASDLSERVELQLAHQECAWVREEPIQAVRERCASIKHAAAKHRAALIVPIRWPRIKADHQRHFAAHFTCYACEVLTGPFPPVFGAGYDRRSWVREAHEAQPQGRVLFVGGDERAWQLASAAGRVIEDVSDAGIHMHIARCDTIAVGDFILQLGVDDDLGR